MSRDLRFGVLGGLMVSRRGSEQPISAAKHRVLLACLLTSPGAGVPVRRLVTCLWGEAPPDNARAVVHTYVSRLRALLGSPSVIETLPEGYQVRVQEHQLDLLRFRALVRRAAGEEDVGAKLDLLDKALAEWRGLPLSDVDSVALHQAEVVRLNAEWRAAADRRAELMLRCGRHVEVLPQLQYLTSEQPLDERLRGQLMLALYQCGNQAAALETYQQPWSGTRSGTEEAVQGDPAWRTRPARPDRPGTNHLVADLPAPRGHRRTRRAHV
ncbi:AfsR/SARP family transcriptional regulator [Allokutzneria oryzae]|uniref:BTAD domain-containing putative transcriptional regulator n=1 Tax=Allokutzneria oryzae TaxID=1378989 RepID=A0ABV5ZNI1_9PSEU